jgi:hypothetical protein
MEEAPSIQIGGSARVIPDLLPTHRDGGAVPEVAVRCVLCLPVPTKPLNNLIWALCGDSDHGPHRVCQRYARHI